MIKADDISIQPEIELTPIAPVFKFLRKTQESLSYERKKEENDEKYEF